MNSQISNQAQTLVINAKLSQIEQSIKAAFAVKAPCRHVNRPINRRWIKACRAIGTGPRSEFLK